MYVTLKKELAGVINVQAIRVILHVLSTIYLFREINNSHPIQQKMKKDVCFHPPIFFVAILIRNVFYQGHIYE